MTAEFNWLKYVSKKSKLKCLTPSGTNIHFYSRCSLVPGRKKNLGKNETCINTIPLSKLSLSVSYGNVADSIWLKN